MHVVQDKDVLKELCLLRGQWGLHISFPIDDQRGLMQAAPYLKDLPPQVAIAGSVFLFFDSEAEARAVYEQTVGKDGPTKTNPYNGPVQVYALLCSDLGSLVTENT